MFFEVILDDLGSFWATFQADDNLEGRLDRPVWRKTLALYAMT